MKRNLKAEKKKEMLRLEAELSANLEAQRNLGFKPLDKPIPHGYRGKWVLRADVARRQDADRFQYILDNFGKSVWSRKEDFKKWCYFTKRVVDIRPSFREIKPAEYENLKPWIKKFFTKGEKHYPWGNVTYTYYYVNIPSHFLVLDMKRDYKTHYKVIDEALKQEEAEIEARLETEFFEERRAKWSWRSSKAWKKIYNRSERSRSKQALKRNIVEAPEGEYYDDIHELGLGKGNRAWW